MVNPPAPDLQDDRAIQIVASAGEIPPGERSAFVERACGSDLPLQQRVQSLLSAPKLAAPPTLNPMPMEQDGPLAAQTIAPISEQPGNSIGRYKLLQQIGEGGFGMVFLAEQERPVRRQIALKVIKLGMDTREVVARFEAERQALAMMDHPNIARVLDAGSTEAGRPYFVMELVRGLPINAYCDKHRLDTRERVRLVAQAARAVQHAHSKGIIHRDLKPTSSWPIRGRIRRPSAVHCPCSRGLGPRARVDGSRPRSRSRGQSSGSSDD